MFGATSVQRILHRSSTSRLPSLPPTPGSPNLPNGTLNNHTPDTPTKQRSQPDLPKDSSLTEESDTDYSDLEEDSKKPKSLSREGKMDTGARKTEVDKEIANVLRTAATNSGAPGVSRIQAAGAVKVKQGVSKWPPATTSSPILPRQRNRNSSNSSSTSSSSDRREGSYHVNPQLQKIGSSERLASTIRQMLPKESSARRGGSVERGDSRDKLVSTSSSVAGNQSANTKSSDPIPIRAGSVKKGVVSTVYKAQVNTATATTSREDSFSSYSSEYTTTDMESSIDVFSPVTTPGGDSYNPPALKGVLTSLPELVRDSSGRAQSIGAVAKRVRLLEKTHAINDDLELQELEEDQVSEMPTFEMRSRTQTLACGHTAGGKRRMEIGRKKLRQHRKEMKRMASVSSSLGISAPVPEHSYKDRMIMRKELELLSPLLQAKIKNMTLKHIYNEYGGKDVVTKAVSIIEEAYRSYTLRKRFNERLREKRENRTIQRKRAMTLKPTRRPSIMAKERQYTRSKNVRQDPMLKSKEAAERLARERQPHAHSGSRLELVQRRRSHDGNAAKTEEGGMGKEEKAKEEMLEAVDRKAKMVSAISISQIELLDDEEEEEGSVETPRETQTEEIIFTLTGVRGEARAESMAEPDGITESASSNSLLQAQRPVSIFSTTSTESSPAGPSLAEKKARSLTLPPASSSQVKQEVKKDMDMKLKTGIYYFNKKPTKGIQYLIRHKLLEDDPKMVADFLIRQSGLSKERIGEFLGNIGSEFNMAVLESLVECSNMGEKPIDEALREFQKMFRMPGEAQKIDKIMEVFALEYYKHNKTLEVFKSEDGAYILSFAIMMLHTSLHNPSVKSRTTRKQWVSMNRGTNDGENFPDSFLLEIFDRIQATEFATGKDHTMAVAELEKQIVGSPIQKLSSPDRFLVVRISANEVSELQARPGFRTKHRRTYFFFNDIALVCKRRHHNEYVFKDSFSLFNILPVKFETHYYKYGIQLHAMDKETPYQFNCDTQADREKLLQQLESVTAHLKLLENERIAELGTTLASTPKPDPNAKASSSQQHLVSGASDLISSMSLALPGSPTQTPNKRREDFVPGVGDILMTSHLTVDFNRSQTTENRISRDSGFVSQQLTPTPPPSPALTDSETIQATTPSPYITPSMSPASSRHTLAPPTAVTPTSLVPPTATPITHSKSSDGIKQVLVTDSPSSSPHRSPSMDFLKRRKSTPSSSANATPVMEAKKKKERSASDKNHKKGLFKRSKKVKEGSASPQPHRRLEQSLTLSFEVGSSLEEVGAAADTSGANVS